MAAFEVFVSITDPNGKKVFINLFSKRLSGMWPSEPLVKGRAEAAQAEADDGGDLNEIKEKYTTKKRNN